MTLASDGDLRALLADGGQLTISPPHSPEEADALIQPASIDLRLSSHFRVFRPHAYAIVDPAQDLSELTVPVTVPKGQPFILHPGEPVLGATYEWIRLERSIAGKVEGKSSLGRLFIVVHHTAGFIDPGFGGHITLELRNELPDPVALWPGMAIAQLQISPVHTASARPYGIKGRGSHYQGQNATTGPQ